MHLATLVLMKTAVNQVYNDVSGLKVMVVDDSPIICLAVEHYLADFGLANVTKVYNGIEALEVFKKEGPDLVVLGLNLPYMDGITCLKKLMQISPDLRVLVISSLSDKETKHLALNQGARAFLTKPFNRHRFQEVFRSVLYSQG